MLYEAWNSRNLADIAGNHLQPLLKRTGYEYQHRVPNCPSRAVRRVRLPSGDRIA